MEFGIARCWFITWSHGHNVFLPHIKYKRFEVFELSLNAFTEFIDKIFVITVKGLKSATSCIKDQDVPQNQKNTCERQAH